MKPLKYGVGIVLGLVVVGFIALVGVSGTGVVTKVGALTGQSNAAAPPTTWQQVFARPVALSLTGFVTGEVLAGPGILIDPDRQGVPAEYQEKIWVPSVAYLLKHPSGKNLVFDAGVKPGDCGYRVIIVVSVPCRNRPSADAVSQLGALGIDRIDFLMVSHFHGDHASGLEQMIARFDPVLLTLNGELESALAWTRELRGYKSAHLQADMRAQTIDGQLRDMPILGPVADIFGDGSVWLIPTPGHTAGHLSALINAASGPILLTFDAAHLEATYDHEAPGTLGATESARTASLESIARLKAFAEAHSSVQLIFGHEPSQWPAVGEAHHLSGQS